MDTNGQTAHGTWVCANIALFLGWAVALFGLLTDDVPARLSLFAGLLVLTGVGLRLEATIRDRLARTDRPA